MPVEWNTLRVGDSVFVHGDNTTLVAATVAFVTTHVATGDENSVGMRVDGTEETYYTLPSPADVHTDPPDRTESCARCRLLHALDDSGTAV